MFLNHIHPKIAKNLVGKTQCVPLLGHTVLKKRSMVCPDKWEQCHVWLILEKTSLNQHESPGRLVSLLGKKNGVLIIFQLDHLKT